MVREPDEELVQYTVSGGRGKVHSRERQRDYRSRESGRAVWAVVKCLFVMESARLGRDKRGATTW